MSESRILRSVGPAAAAMLSIAAVLLPVSPASAHGDGDGSEHAQQDLAGIPITQIEQNTARNAQRILRETGRRPGTLSSAQAARSRAAAAVSDDPGVSGKWSPVTDTEVVPVFQALLPDGKVLVWDSVGDNAAESYGDHSFTRAMVWNPADDTFKRVDVQGANIFCAGFTHLADGDILVAGGNKDAALTGIVQTHVFDWQTETWKRGADMVGGRWYPSVTELANGEAVILGGGPAVPEVYQQNGLIRALSGSPVPVYAGRAYPFTISRPDTLLGLLGPYATAYSLDPAGNGALTGASNRDAITRDYGSFVTYDIGKTLVVGGGKLTEDGASNVPTRTAVVANTNAGLVPTVTATGSMATGRRQFNTTVLPDGTVLATGGETSAAVSPLVDLDHAATAAERWDPATGAWTVLAGAGRIRQYHSTATLLPDGRVMTGGGGVCGACVQAGYLEKNIEYFTPPYLYKKDGSGEPADRPVIASAPTTLGVGAPFTVTSSQAAGIRKVALVGLSDVTHGGDWGQRYVPLKFSVSGTTLTVVGPPNSGVTPPGPYMLFVTDSSGVPSVARIVNVAGGPTPLLSPVKNTAAARCLDVPSSSLAARTYLQTYTCNTTKAQALTRLPDDNTLRVLGNCLDVPSRNFAAGQKIWAYGCNGSIAQTWQFGSDGTIRPRGGTTFCLAPASTNQNAALLLAGCNGSTLQKWTW